MAPGRALLVPLQGLVYAESAVIEIGGDVRLGCVSGEAEGEQAPLVDAGPDDELDGGTRPAATCSIGRALLVVVSTTGRERNLQHSIVAEELASRALPHLGGGVHDAVCGDGSQRLPVAGADVDEGDDALGDAAGGGRGEVMVAGAGLRDRPAVQAISGGRGQQRGHAHASS